MAGKGRTRTAIPGPPGADQLERRRADWEATAGELRELLRDGHRLLADLRAERTQVLGALDPAKLAALVDERIAAAVREGLAGYRTVLERRTAEASQAVMDRFDTMCAALLGDEDAAGGLEAALRRFLDRQRRLDQANGGPAS